MLINHEVKNNEQDTPGLLINKFASNGRVRVRATADNNMTFSIDFYIENKDLFAHLLKPSVPFNISLVNTRQSFSGSAIIVCPCVFPDGIINSITLPNSNVSNIKDFEIAAFGNTHNSFNGSTKWFYCEYSQFKANDSCTFTYNNEASKKSIIPYSYNFLCIRIKGDDLPCRAITDLAQTALLNHDIQYKFYGDLRTIETINLRDTDKMEAEYIPYFQLDILKGV